MSMLIAGISGFLKERNVMAGEEAAARAKEAEAEAEKHKLVMTNLLKAATDPKYPQSPDFQETLRAENLDPFIRTSNAMADVAGTSKYGMGKQGTVPLVSELKYGSGMSPYGRAQVMWDSWEKHFSNPETYAASLEYFRNNDNARTLLQNDVRKNEFEIRVGNIKRQTGVGFKEDGIQYVAVTGVQFCFTSRRRHTRCSRDWSSDVCSSDLNIFTSFSKALVKLLMSLYICCSLRVICYLFLIFY